jgi:hypothetical protein
LKANRKPGGKRNRIARHQVLTPQDPQFSYCLRSDENNPESSSVKGQKKRPLVAGVFAYRGFGLF